MVFSRAHLSRCPTRLVGSGGGEMGVFCESGGEVRVGLTRGV